jgi:(R,R)-butanediol dehydrogenase / meso-butanediol dehydrogenase / diacetyl reductase
MSVDELADPEPAAAEVALVPEAAAICGSDVEGYGGHQANRRPPLVMGHEFAGRVAAVGEGVDPGWVGARVSVNPLVADPDAPVGLENLGRRRELIGVHRPGAFASSVLVPAGQLSRLPEGTDPRIGALAEPLANGVHAARIGRTGVEGGEVERAAVIGAGPIGLLALQGLALGGLRHVTVVELDPERRAAAAALGADEVLDDGQRLEGGLDVVVDAVGAPATRALTIGAVRPGGCAVMLGLASDEAPVRFHALVRDGITVRGSYAYTREDYATALQLLLDGRAGLGELEPVLPLEAGPEQFAELARGAGTRLRVFLAP